MRPQIPAAVADVLAAGPITLFCSGNLCLGPLGRFPNNATINSSADIPPSTTAPPPYRAKLSLELTLRTRFCIPHHPLRSIIFPHSGRRDNPPFLARWGKILNGEL